MLNKTVCIVYEFKRAKELINEKNRASHPSSQKNEQVIHSYAVESILVTLSIRLLIIMENAS